MVQSAWGIILGALGSGEATGGRWSAVKLLNHRAAATSRQVIARCAGRRNEFHSLSVRLQFLCISSHNLQRIQFYQALCYGKLSLVSWVARRHIESHCPVNWFFFTFAKKVMFSSLSVLFFKLLLVFPPGWHRNYRTDFRKTWDERDEKKNPVTVGVDPDKGTDWEMFSRCL